MHRILIALCLVLFGLNVGAEERPVEPLVVPFVPIAPFAQLGSDGTRTGFLVELAKMIGDEIDVPIIFRDVRDTAAFVDLQVSGESHLIAGIAKIPPLRSSNVFSVPVATEDLRPIVLAPRMAEFEQGEISGQRVGIVPPALGSQETAFLARNTLVVFERPKSAVMALLTRDIDVLLIPEPVAFSVAKRAGVDGRIHFVGGAMRTVERFVALHESRADLLDPINAAIARIEADGRLDTLKRRFGLVLPKPMPAVVTVGVAHIPPHMIIDEDGNISGLTVQIMRDLADRIGLEITFQTMPLSQWVQGPTAAQVDVISALAVTVTRSEAMDFTSPVLEWDIAAVTRKGTSTPMAALNAMPDKRLGVLANSVLEALAQNNTKMQIVPMESGADLLAALMSSDIDAFIYPENSLADLLGDHGGTDEVRLSGWSVKSTKLAIALRYGLGALRTQLNAAIPPYLLSERYNEVRQKYFGVPVFWTPQRMNVLVGILCAGLVGFLVYTVWKRQRRQEREIARQDADLKREKAHSDALNVVVKNLERSNRELDEFAYIASHDLKEPLRGIGINANFLMREDLPEKAAARAKRMGQLAGRMEQLISDLLAFSRLARTGTSRVVLQPKDVIVRIRNELSEWLAEHGGKIVEVGAIPSIEAEPLHVYTILQNLIVNGIKYNDAADKYVEVGFAPETMVNGQIIKNAIFVKDNGIGIGEKYRDKVFRIFSRLNKEAEYDTGGSPGTGSGLAFVRKIVEDHGGIIDFTSTPGQGTTFYVTLPLAETKIQRAK